MVKLAVLHIWICLKIQYPANTGQIKFFPLKIALLGAEWQTLIEQVGSRNGSCSPEMRSLRRDHQSEIRGAHQNQNRDLVSWWLGRENSLSIGYHVDSPENKGPENTMLYHHVPIKSAIQFFVGEKTMLRHIYINIILLVLDIQLYSLHAHSGWL